MIWLLALACSGLSPTQAPVKDGDADLGPGALTATVTSKAVEKGKPVQLTVQARQPDGWTARFSQPASEGLELSLVDESGPVQLNGATQATWHYELSGDPGSYVIAPGSAELTDPDGQTTQIDAAPIFVDIGVAGPSSKVSDFEAPPPPAPTPWGLYAAVGGGLIVLVGAGVALWLWSRRKPVVLPPPDPAHVVARRAWQQLRSQGLPDHPQAVALSKVLRTYLEATTGWPATMRTGSEILAWMASESLAGATARAHAGRILDATDRLKFAREGGGDDFFAALDTDFDVVIEATRPVVNQPAVDLPTEGQVSS